MLVGHSLCDNYGGTDTSRSLSNMGVTHDQRVSIARSDRMTDSQDKKGKRGSKSDKRLKVTKSQHHTTFRGDPESRRVKGTPGNLREFQGNRMSDIVNEVQGWTRVQNVNNMVADGQGQIRFMSGKIERDKNDQTEDKGQTTLQMVDVILGHQREMSDRFTRIQGYTSSD